MARPRPRDTGCRAVYAAEEQLHLMLERQHDCPTVTIAGATVVLPTERRFGDIEGAQRYVDSVLALDWVRRDFPGVDPIRVRARNGDQRAHYLMGVIALPTTGDRWAMREAIVLHELAHGLDGSGGPAHGPVFREILCKLLSECLAPEAGFLLQVMLHQHAA